jgi:hypothetical protein
MRVDTAFAQRVDDPSGFVLIHPGKLPPPRRWHPEGRRVSHYGHGIDPAQFGGQRREFCGGALIKVTRAMTEQTASLTGIIGAPQPARPRLLRRRR